MANLMKYLMRMFVFFCLIIGFETVHAETATLGTYPLNQYFHAHMESDGHFNRYGQMLNKKISGGVYSGAQAYCIAPGEEVTKNTYNINLYNQSNILDIVNNTQSINANKYTLDQLNRMQLYAHYGYGYKNHTDNVYIAATQMLIYRTKEDTVFTNALCTGGCSRINDPDNVVTAMNEIQALVDRHYVAPSFHGTTVNMVKGETRTFTDSNNILSEFSVKECTNCSANISGNTLSLTATGAGNISVILEKNTNTYGNGVLFLTDASSQNFITNGNVDPIASRITGIAVDGEVEIEKIDETGKNLTGVKFGVYNSNNEQVCSITTSDGFGKCSGLQLGTFTVKELETIEGYVKSDQTWSFTLTTDDTKASLKITNEKIKGYIEIYKVDAENNKSIPQGDGLLNNAVYGIYDSNGVRVGQLVTDKNGYAKSDLLEYGEYTVKEELASLGYLVDSKEYKVKVSNNLETITVTSKEQIIKFNFHLSKVKGNGKTGVVEAEPNAVFNIYLKSNNYLAGTITTNSKGQANITLPYGKYNVCQISGPADTEDAECFEIDIKDKDIDKEVLNDFITSRIKIVKVDSKTNKVLPIAGIKFKIKNLSTGEYVCQTISYPNNNKVCVFETTEEGILYTPYALDAGQYQLEELDQVIDGYLWNSNPLKFEIRKDSNFEYDDELGVILEVRFANQEVLGKIIIHKTGEDFIIENGKFYYKEVPLKGVKFGLYDKNGKLLTTVVTDKNGYAEFTDLKLGKYIVKEIETENGYVLNNQEYEFNLEYKDQYTAIIEKEITLKNYLKKGTIEFTKTDFVDNEPIPNTLMELYTENNELIFTGRTNSKGKITIKDLKVGRYYFVEKEAPEGYLLNEDKLWFEITEDGEIVKSIMKDQRVEGVVSIHKDGEKYSIVSECKDTTKCFIYETERNLKGIHFGLYAAEDIILNNIKRFSKGDLVVDGYTDQNGNLIFDKLYLGNYILKELDTIDNYALDTTEYQVSLEYTDSKTPIVGLSFILKNHLIKSDFEFTKTDISTDEPLPNTLIEIHSEDGTLIYRGYTDESGKVVLKNMPSGKFYLLEVEAPEGYVLNEEPMYFEIKDNGEVVKSNMKNEKIKSTIIIHKIGSDRETLQGVKIGIYDLDGNLLYECYTDENGNIEIELEYGKYYYQELESIDGYELNSEKIYFEVIENKAIIETSLINIKVPSTGLNDYHVVEILGGLLILSGLGVAIYVNKKKKNK